MQLATITLIVQILFYLVLCAGVAVQLKANRGNPHLHKWHDRLQAPVVVLNILFILFVMIPSFRALAGDLPAGLAEVPTLVTVIHVTLGTIAQLLAIYLLLAGFKVLPRKIGKLRYWMWTGFVAWTLTILFGIGVYILFYTGESEAEVVVVEEHDADIVESVVEEPGAAVPPEVAVPVVEHDEELIDLEPTAAVADPEPEEVVGAEHDQEIIEPSPTPSPSPTPAPVPVGTFFISDAEIHGDQANLELSEVRQLAEGLVYEAWLAGANTVPFSIGRLAPDGDTVNYTFVDPVGRNLLELYDAMFITIESVEDADPAPSSVVAYRGAVPPAVLEQVRLAVVAAPDTPDGDGYAFNARAEVEKIFAEVGFQQDFSIAQNDLPALKIQAEGIINILEGANGPNYGDSDGNGEIYVTSGSDLVGLLGPEGYLQRAVERAQAAGQAEGATENVRILATQTQTAAENAFSLAEQIRDLELQILTVDRIADAVELVRQVTDLTNALRDTDRSGLTNPSRGGVLAAYTFGQQIGTIEIFAEPVPETTPKLVGEHDADEISEHDAADISGITEPEFTGESGFVQWAQLNPVNAGPGARYAHALQYNAATHQIYLFGGRDSSQIYNDVWVLNVDDLTWRQLAAGASIAPPPRHTAVMIVDAAAENLYVAVGQNQNGVLDDIWRLDLTTETWEELTPVAGQAPAPRYGSPGGNLSDNLLLTHGFGSTRFDDTWRFNTRSKQWEKIVLSGAVPLKRCLFAAAPSADNVVIHGGCASGFGDCFLDDTWILDTGANVWREVLSDVKPIGRQHQTLTAAENVPNRIILFGGQDAGRAARSDLWFLDLSTGSWRPVEGANFPEARYNHAAVWISRLNGLFIYGGQNEGGSLDDAWLATF